ncbi:MAG TPA: aldehyde dehydrogenase family protein [Gaiellaceae bacterium]|jgi:succinate-semialdehyde dehydrogenase/glutarate-semialdehyde dehydrogenase
MARQSQAAPSLRSVDPATLEEVGSVPVSPPEEVAEAVAEARIAGERWARSSFAERRELLGAVAEEALAAAEELAVTVTAETGKPLVESYTAELFVALDNLVWAAANAPRVLSPQRLRYPQRLLRHKRGWLLYEPLGAVAVVSPWNFPLGIPLSQAVFAVAAGNAVVVKPSELTPLTGAWVQRLFRSAGAPEGLVRVVQGGPETGASLVRAHGIAKVVFTGSAEAGRSVAAAAGERLRPVTLELGGKDPMLVFEDADLDRAVAGALWGAFSNCGQVCSSVERIYVAQPLQEAFVEELVRRARSLRIGAGHELETDLGPVISEERRAHVETLVEDAVARGAEVRTGGGRPEVGLPGWFHEPTVLTGVEREARVQLEEIFGPVVTVGSFRDEDEAVRLANGSAFGLGASVWTRDLDRAQRLARRLEAGSVWTNDVSYSYGTGQASWGGTKESGFGRTHGRHGLYELSRVKFADLDRGRVPVQWWYPYDRGVLDGFAGVLELLYGERLPRKLAKAWQHRRGLVRLGRRYFSGS